MEFQIYNEDCLEGMKRIPAGSVDMVLTDLPFNITDCFWDKEFDLADFWTQVRRVLKLQASAVLFASGNFVYKLLNSNIDCFRYKWIWVKNQVTDFVNAKNRPMHRFEEILVFSESVPAHKGKSSRRMNYYPQGLTACLNVRKDQRTVGGRVTSQDLRKKVYAFWNQAPKMGGAEYIQTQRGYPKDVLFFDAPNRTERLHPNQKPVDLLEYLIRTYTNEGETVLDATMGSGSTGVACVNTSRKFIGFELEKKFFDIAEKRIAEALANKQQELF